MWAPFLEAWKEVVGKPIVHDMFHISKYLGEAVDLVRRKENRILTKEGTDPSIDPLLPLFQEVFEEDANRFSHTWDDLNTQLLPVLKDKLQALLSSKGISVADFDVTLAPFHTDQQFMAAHSPESSSTDTWEWTGTPLIGADLSPTGHCLLAGGSVDGGSGYVGSGHPSVGSVGGGARLAVVVKCH